MIRPLILVTLALGVAMSASDALAAQLPDFIKLWDFQNPGKTETAFREILPQARASGDKGYVAELLTQIARAQGLQRKFEDAHKTLDEAEALLTDDLKKARVRCLLERGRAFNSAGNKDKAKPLFMQAWEVATKANEETLAVDAAHMMGIVEEPAKALEWNLKAIDYCEKSKNPKVTSWLGPLYNNTGWTFYEKGDYPRALELLTKAQAFYLKHGTPNQIRVAKYSVGKTLRALGKVEDGLRIQQALKAEYLELKEEDGYVDEELGECLLALKKPDEARPHFKKAYELLSKDEWLVENEPKRLERLKNLAGI
jgi:tetratricopeptide (TPR) repeat protein